MRALLLASSLCLSTSCVLFDLAEAGEEPRSAPACHQTGVLLSGEVSIAGVSLALDEEMQAALSLERDDDGRCTAYVRPILSSTESPGTCRFALMATTEAEEDLQGAWEASSVSLTPSWVALKSNPYDCAQWEPLPVGEFKSLDEGSIGTVTLKPVEAISDACAAFELEFEFEPELLDNGIDLEGPLAEHYETLQFEGASLSMMVEFDRVALQDCEEALR